MRAVALDHLFLELEQRHAVQELGHRIGEVVLAPDDHRRLDVAVRDRLRQRVAVDDLLGRRLGMRRRRQTDEQMGIEVAHGLRERRPVVGVVLVGEHDEILGLLQAGVERGAEALLKLVGLLAELRAGLRQRLDGEYEQLDPFGIVHRRPHRRAREVLRGDDHGFDLHSPEQAALAAGGEVLNGL